MTSPGASGLGSSRPSGSRHGPRGADHLDLRRANLGAVLRFLHVHGAASRSELVAATGLNRSTVAALVSDLAARGLVLEEPGPRGTPGRPSPVVAVRHDTVAVLAVEIFGDTLAVGTIGLGGRILGLRRIPRRRDEHAVERTLADLRTLLVDLLAGEPKGRQIVAAGVAVAGLVRRRDGVVRLAPNVGWQDVPLADRLAEFFPPGLPIRVGNDADLAALAEHLRGAGAGVDDFLLLWGEQGVGAGIIAGSEPLVGHSGYGGEAGHLPLGPLDRRCRCGAWGCWETVVGEEALLAAAGRDGREDRRRAVEEVLAALRDGEPQARAAAAELGRHLGVGVAGLVNVFNPARVAFGGLFELLFPFVLPAVETELDRRAMAAPREDVELVAARLGADAPLLGAAELAWAPILADPLTVPHRTPSPRGAPMAIAP